MAYIGLKQLDPILTGSLQVSGSAGVTGSLGLSGNISGSSTSTGSFGYLNVFAIYYPPKTIAIAVAWSITDEPCSKILPDSTFKLPVTNKEPVNL